MDARHLKWNNLNKQNIIPVVYLFFSWNLRCRSVVGDVLDIGNHMQAPRTYQHGGIMASEQAVLHALHAPGCLHHTCSVHPAGFPIHHAHQNCGAQHRYTTVECEAETPACPTPDGHGLEWC